MNFSVTEKRVIKSVKILSNTTLSWDMTRACNLSCGHCSNADDRARAGRDLNLADAVRVLAEFAEAGGEGLHLLGGEPLLRKDLLQIIVAARRLGLEVSLTTNGTLVPDEAGVDILLAAVSVLTISIDGADAAVNDAIRGPAVLARARKALAFYRDRKRARGRGSWLNVSHVLCASNVDGVTAMVDLAQTEGADEISITYLKPYGAALASGAPEAATPERLMSAFEAAARRAEAGGLRVTLFEIPKRVQARLRRDIGSAVMFGGDVYCDTGEGQLRLASDGAMHGCFASTKHHGLADVAAELSVARRAVRDIVAGPTFAEFKARAHDALAATAWDICQGCEAFAARTCYPGCPFEPLNVKPRLCALLEAIA